MGWLWGGPKQPQAGPYPGQPTPIPQAILLPADEVRERPAGAGREEPNQDPFLGGVWKTGSHSIHGISGIFPIHEEFIFYGKCI